MRRECHCGRRLGNGGQEPEEELQDHNGGGVDPAATPVLRTPSGPGHQSLVLGLVQRDRRLGKTAPPEVVPVLGEVSRLVGARPCRRRSLVARPG